MESLQEQTTLYKKEMAAYTGDAETFRIKYLGTKGIIKTVMNEMKNVPPAEKKTSRSTAK